jgi:integrase
LIDIRNLALLQVGYFGAFRRSELVNIKWEHITFSKQGMEILIPKSKTDQISEGQQCAIPYGNEELCAVTALLHWQQQTNLKEGFVFRRLSKTQSIQKQPIAPNHVNIILKKCAKAAKLENAEQYSGHSLRVGFATEASRKGAPFKAIMRQGRWKSESTVLGYIEAGQSFEENAVDTMLDK